MAKKKKRNVQKSEPSEAGQTSRSAEQTVPLQQPAAAAATPASQASTSARQSGNREQSENEKLAQELSKQLTITDIKPRRPFPKRPDSLKSGRAVRLLTNHFLLKVGKKTAFHYDIEIKEEDKKTEKDTNVVDKNVPESDEQKAKKQNIYTRKMATKINRMIFRRMVQLYSQNPNQCFYGIHPVYDGQKNMFTSKILNGTQHRHPLTLRVTLEDENRAFLVTIKLAETNERVDLDVLNQYHNNRTCDDEVVKKSILFINTLLRHNASMDWIPIGQSIFDPEAQGQKISSYLMLMYGVYTSVRSLMIGPTLNVDRSAACFYDPSISLLSIIGQLLKCTDLSRAASISDSDRRKIKKELTGLQIEATHNQYNGRYRKYRILGVSKDTAKSKFAWRAKEGNVQVDKGQVSIEEYFFRQHNKRLIAPQLPVLEVGNPRNIVKLPIEVCRLVSHQRLRRSMKNSEKAEMTRISGQMPPHTRFETCREFVVKQFINGEVANRNRPYLAEFEINVDQNLMKVNSVVIPPPTLKYDAVPNGIQPKYGEWEMYKDGAKFIKPASLDKWIVINMSFNDSFRDDNVNTFIKDLCNQAKEMGIGPFPRGPSLPLKNIIIKDTQTAFNPKSQFIGIKNNLRTIPSLKGLQMILFITPSKQHRFSEEIYGEIKRLGDVDSGLTTQCVNIDSIWNPRDRRGPRKWNRSYLRQLMLKVNPKLGGTNVALCDSASMPSILRNNGLMIVGADVNHPAPADKISPSIAALVASYDRDYTNYYTSISMQPKSREEMIKHLDSMMNEALKSYFRKNKVLPQRIVFYRDGVSEGQFQHVIDNEYDLLFKAFSKISATYKPKLTFIVVQKRHHTRFMVEDTKRNVDPGTVVEKAITHKNDFDFYLCSHNGRIGTSRSAHYYVLADENNFNSDDMCRMTYYLCHLYQRCTKSVSIPAPVYYADLAAYRAKVHASTLDDMSETASDIGSEGGDQRENDRIETYKNAITVTESQRERLYFC